MLTFFKIVFLVSFANFQSSKPVMVEHEVFEVPPPRVEVRKVEEWQNPEVKPFPEGAKAIPADQVEVQPVADPATPRKAQ